MGSSTPPLFMGSTLLSGDTGVSGLREADILVKSITDLRYNIRSVMVFVDVQLPLPFIQIVSAVVWAFMVQLVMMCASYVAYGWQYRDGPSVTTGYITIVLYSFALLGLLRLFHVLSNPMEATHKSNFPHETYMREYIHNLHTIKAEGFAFVSHGDVFRHRSSASKYPLSMRIDAVTGISNSRHHHHDDDDDNKIQGTMAEAIDLTSRSSVTTGDGFSSNHYDRGRMSERSDDTRASFCSVTPLVDEHGARYHVPDYDNDEEYGRSRSPLGVHGVAGRARDVGQHRFVVPRVQVPSGSLGSFWNRLNVSHQPQPLRQDVIPPVTFPPTPPSTTSYGDNVPVVPPG